MDEKYWPMFAHQLDAAWIKYIWLAIHAGDPSVEVGGDAIDLTIAALVAQLRETTPAVEPAEMIKRLKSFDLTVMIKTADGKHEPASGIEHYSLVSGNQPGSLPEICLTNGYNGEICRRTHPRVGGPTDAQSD
ncbi:hypothetical protein [Paraburkholderia pallida]|uniref:Uncharacterized protein n=1 Tax=Paraburkholderia pallida TaxID=2547399 RepID=A0A4P7D4A2_9BURK|nr:hypothetical protein [Paraburkholderia pallida]QBR01680.1 hypothetical protein E1956_31455 [Paraburkholderia pallida]